MNTRRPGMLALNDVLSNRSEHLKRKVRWAEWAVAGIRNPIPYIFDSLLSAPGGGSTPGCNTFWGLNLDPLFGTSHKTK